MAVGGVSPVLLVGGPRCGDRAAVMVPTDGEVPAVCRVPVSVSRPGWELAEGMTRIGDYGLMRDPVFDLPSMDDRGWYRYQWVGWVE